MSNYTISQKNYDTLDKNMNIVFVSAEFNKPFIEQLENINQAFLEKQGFRNIHKYSVPGAFEIPGFVSKILHSQHIDMILIFWVVIRGATTHYEIISEESARWLMDISLHLPIHTTLINGILTCENQQQVQERISDTYARSWLNLALETLKINNQ